MLQVIATATLNSVLSGMLLFLMASGLTLIFSMMGVLNFAHASFYMLGAFLGFQFQRWFGFAAGLVLAPVVSGLLGAAVERVLLRTVHRQGHMAELLLTVGLAAVMVEAVKAIWGSGVQDYRIPASLDVAAFSLFGINYPLYRVIGLGIAIAVFLGLFLMLARSRIGLIIQAALTHPEMVGMLGHDVPRVQMLVFGLGCGLAGLAGAVAAPMLVTGPDMADAIGALLFVVIIVGGLGSLTGAFLASLLVGFIQTFAVASDLTLGRLAAALGMPIASEAWSSVALGRIGPLIPYALMILLLMLRPGGLMGGRA
jgi:branched-chain amino acid transport system permease protein